MTDITDATLKFFKSKTISNVGPVSIAAVSREVWHSISAPDASLTVREDAKIVGDRRLLLQSFEQLFQNAVEHVRDDSSVVVGTLRKRQVVTVLIFSSIW